MFPGVVFIVLVCINAIRLTGMQIELTGAEQFGKILKTDAVAGTAGVNGNGTGGGEPVSGYLTAFNGADGYPAFEILQYEIK